MPLRGGRGARRRRPEAAARPAGGVPRRRGQGCGLADRLQPRPAAAARQPAGAVDAPDGEAAASTTRVAVATVSTDGARPTTSRRRPAHRQGSGHRGRPMSDGPTRIRVGGSSTADHYDVVVGTDPLGELPGLLGSSTVRVAVMHPWPSGGFQTRSSSPSTSRLRRCVLAEVPDGEPAKDVTVAAQLWSLLGRPGSRVRTPSSPVGRRSDHRPRRLRRGHVAARRPRRARAHHAAGHGRCGSGRQDRDRHLAEGKNPGRRLSHPAGVLLRPRRC